MIVSVPASARGEEPVTGASIISMPRGRQLCCDSARVASGRSSTCPRTAGPARAPSRAPSSPRSTEATCAPSTTMLTTMSLARQPRRACLLRGAVLGCPLARPCPVCASTRVSAIARLGDVRRHPRAHDPQAQEADRAQSCRILLRRGFRCAVRLSVWSGRDSACSGLRPPPPPEEMRRRSARGRSVIRRTSPVVQEVAAWPAWRAPAAPGGGWRRRSVISESSSPRAPDLAHHSVAAAMLAGAP